MIKILIKLIKLLMKINNKKYNNMIYYNKIIFSNLLI